MRTINIHSEKEVAADVLVKAETWGKPGYETVDIYDDGPKDFYITFKDNGGHRFVMGAIWREAEKRFTFHS